MTTATPSLADHLTISIAEVRASIAAEERRKGLKRALLAAILGFLETLAALLAEFRAGRLVAMTPTPRAASPAWAASAACAAGDEPAAGIRPVRTDRRADHEPPRVSRAGRSKDGAADRGAAVAGPILPPDPSPAPPARYAAAEPFSIFFLPLEPGIGTQSRIGIFVAGSKLKFVISGITPWCDLIVSISKR
jgi:hypothetical protein